jgi:hypothetical protein
MSRRRFTLFVTYFFLLIAAHAQQWGYKTLPPDGFLTKCVDPSGVEVGDWVDCRTDQTCTNPRAITDRCQDRHPKSRQELPEHVVIGAHLDNVRQPKSILRTLSECGNDDACQRVAQLIASVTEIPVDKIVRGAAVISPASAATAEGTYFDFGLPAGYSYCSATINTASIVPHDGPRGSTLLARADKRKLYVETWTPVLPLAQGRTWAEADIRLIGVRDDLASSAYASSASPCYAPNSRIILYCRGGGCEQPRSTTDKGQSVNASSPPGASSRN